MEKAVSWAALFLAVVACIIGAYVLSRPRSHAVDEAAVEAHVYQRIVSETYREMKPVYEDFGIPVESEPKTIADLIRPMLSVNQELSPKP